MRIAKRALRLTAASGMIIAASSAAHAQQQPPPPTPVPNLPSIINSEMYRNRAEHLHELEYDRSHHQARKKDAAATSADRRRLKLSREEQQAFGKAQAALQKKDYAAADAAITAGQQVAESPDAKYALGALQLQLGYATRDKALQAKGVEAALNSGVAPARLLPQLYRHQGVAALETGDFAKAEAALVKLTELKPRDANALVLLAETKHRARKPAEALPLFEKAVALKKASGKRVPEAWTSAVEVMEAMVKAQGLSHH